jgi:hypothetical protein
VTGERNNKARPLLRNGPQKHGRRKRRWRKRREGEIRRRRQLTNAVCLCTLRILNK